MGDGTKENPYTREDVLKKIEEHSGPEELAFSGIMKDKEGKLIKEW